MGNKKSTSSGKPEKVIEIRLSFLVTAIVTFVVLIGVVVGIFVIANLDKDDTVIRGGSKDKSKTEQGTTADKSPSVQAGANNTPLFPTTEKRTSYKITTSSDVVMLTTETGANNTVLVKVGADGLVSTVEKNADAKMYPASMTKVMTLLVACERVTDLDKTLTVTKEIAQYAQDNDGSGAGLKVGESYKVRDLLYLISYQSDTIASILIAEHIAGSEAAFVELMNQKVQSMGLEGTHFVNCTGLYNAEHYSTCKDIASIMAYALDNELAYKILTSYNGYKMTVGGVDCTFYAAWYSGRPSTNHLGFSDNPKLSNTRIIAGKTGYTDESGFTFVTVSQSSNGDRYINVTVGKPSGNGYNANLFMTDLKKLYNTYAK